MCIATSIKMRLSSQYKLGRGKVDQILTSSDTRMRAGKLSDEQPKQYSAGTKTGIQTNITG